MHHTHTEDVLLRIGDVEAHLRAIAEMVRSGQPCPQVLMEMASARSALGKAARIVLADHTEHCLLDAAHRGEAESELAALEATIDRLF